MGRPPRTASLLPAPGDVLRLQPADYLGGTLALKLVVSEVDDFASKVAGLEWFQVSGRDSEDRPRTVIARTAPSEATKGLPRRIPFDAGRPSIPVGAEDARAPLVRVA